MYGSQKSILETNRVRSLAYALLGEVHVPGRLRAYHVLRQVRRLKLAGGRMGICLDAGSGRGDLLMHLAQKYPTSKFTGIEYDAERAELARALAAKLQLTNVSFVQGDLGQRSGLGPFDLITCCDVLEHIEDDRSVLRNLRDMLAPGGTLLLTFPSLPQRRHLALVRWREKRIGFKDSDYGHVRQGYSVEGIGRILEELEFKQVRCLPTFGFWGTLAFDLFFVLGDNQPNPYVFMAAFPFLMAFAGLDLLIPVRRGSGLLVAAVR